MVDAAVLAGTDTQRSHDRRSQPGLLTGVLTGKEQARACRPDLLSFGGAAGNRTRCSTRKNAS